MMAGELFFSLSGFRGAINSDGTKPEITIEMNGADAARFYTTPDGLGALIAQLQSLARESFRRLKESGKAEKYQAGQFDVEASEIISVQIGLEEPRRHLSLALQTEGGAMVRYRMAHEATEHLIAQLQSTLPELAETDAGKRVQ